MRLRLIALVGATSSVVLVAFLVPLAILVRSAAADRAVSAAIVEVQALAPVVAMAADEAVLRQAVDAVNADSAHPMTVFLPDGRTLGAPASRSAASAQAATGQSLTATSGGGREVLVAVGGLPSGTAVIRTFVPRDELTAGVLRSWLVLGLLGVALLTVSMLVADQLARTLVRSLSSMANVSYRLAHGSLGARAADEGPPELRQVGAGLNYLAARINELLAQERATVADLSHRLRTPLTALRIDLESLVDAQTRTRLIADLDAVDKTVDDVIREAGRPARDGGGVSCDAVAVVGFRTEFWSVLAEEERRHVHTQLPAGPLPVGLSAEDLSTCIDALIGNVFAHTPEGTAFRVSLAPRPGGGAVLVVSDDGTGMPSAPALERGFSGRGSTGLGLDIVSRSADRAGGRVPQGASPTGGAEVTVELGPPTPPVVRSHRDRPVAPRR